MKARYLSPLFALVLGGTCWAARCTTILDLRALREYESYLRDADEVRLARIGASELSWVREPRGQAQNELHSGNSVRRSITLGPVNDRIGPWNGTVIHWIGAIQINGASIVDLKTVLQDYGRYSA